MDSCFNLVRSHQHCMATPCRGGFFANHFLCVSHFARRSTEDALIIWWRRFFINKMTKKNLKLMSVCHFLLCTAIERDSCHPNPCHHGGVCEIEGDDFLCSCISGWTGMTCEGKGYWRCNKTDHCPRLTANEVHENWQKGKPCYRAITVCLQATTSLRRLQPWEAWHMP